MTAMTAPEIFALMHKVFPTVKAMNFEIEQLDDDTITLSRHTTDQDLRPGHTISGPAMMTMVDTAAYFLILSRIGPEALAVTTNLNINFLRKPVPGKLTARGELLKLGKRLVIVEVSLYTEASDKRVAHATVTYSIPPHTSSQP